MTDDVEQRRRWAEAQKRQRARNDAGEKVFKLALNADLVAAALIVSRRDGDRDTGDHRVCEALLAPWVEEMLQNVIDDVTPDESMREIVRELRATLRNRVCA